MIQAYNVTYMDIYDVLSRFNELTGFTSDSGGIWNADKTKKIYSPIYPKAANGYCMSGESKYLCKIAAPSDFTNYDFKEMSKDINMLLKYGKEKCYRDISYIEIDFFLIVLWLYVNGEIPDEEIVYYYEW